VKSLYKPIYGI